MHVTLIVVLGIGGVGKNMSTLKSHPCLALRVEVCHGVLSLSIILPSFTKLWPQNVHPQDQPF